MFSCRINKKHKAGDGLYLKSGKPVCRRSIFDGGVDDHSIVDVDEESLPPVLIQFLDRDALQFSGQFGVFLVVFGAFHGFVVNRLERRIFKLLGEIDPNGIHVNE